MVESFLLERVIEIEELDGFPSSDFVDIKRFSTVRDTAPGEERLDSCHSQLGRYHAVFWQFSIGEKVIDSGEAGHVVSTVNEGYVEMVNDTGGNNLLRRSRGPFTLSFIVYVMRWRIARTSRSLIQLYI